MNKCDYCGKILDEFPHKCKFCSRIHCSQHLIPELHNCEGLKRHKEENKDKWKKTFSNLYSPPRNQKREKEEKVIQEKEVLSKKEINKFSGNKIKYLFLKKFENIEDWLRKREHHKYDFRNRTNYLIITILIFVASIIGCLIFYSNAQKLNEINLWIIKLGGILILTSLFFVIKYGWRMIKEIVNIIKRQKNGIKYLVIILIIILLWQAYSNKDTILNPVLERYNKINLSLFKPINFENLNLEDSSNSIDSTVQKIINKPLDYSIYETGAKNIKLDYFDFIVYKGVNDYLAGLDRSINYYYSPPTTKDFILKDLNNEVQKEFLIPLVEKIKNKTQDKKSQANIAIKIVQEIPYDWEAYNSNNIDGRYPYEVLYDMKGVCMEKSDLLAFLLRELGFGVAIFEFDTESHRAVGIKCEEGNYNSNYCFIESTDTYPIGQIPYEYVGGVDIKNAIPEIVIINDGFYYD